MLVENEDENDNEKESPQKQTDDACRGGTFCCLIPGCAVTLSFCWGSWFCPPLLLNVVEDRSYMSDPMGYEVFRDAGVPAPRTAYAYLSVSVAAPCSKETKTARSKR